MSFIEAMREIESHAFIARLGIASDFNSLLRAMKLEPSVQTISDELESRDKQDQVLSKILSLVRQRTDIRYENPWDIALTVYLWLLSSKGLSAARVAAQVIAEAQQCWWAKELAGKVLSDSYIHTASANTMNYASITGLVFKKSIEPVSTSSEFIFCSNFLVHHSAMSIGASQTSGAMTTTYSSSGELRWHDDDRPTINFNNPLEMAA